MPDGSALIGRPQVDAQGQHAVDQIGFGIADHGEVLEVGLRLGDELLAFLAGHRGEGAPLDRGGSLLESNDHLLGIELCHAVESIRCRDIGSGRQLGATARPEQSSRSTGTAVTIGWRSGHDRPERYQ